MDKPITNVVGNRLHELEQEMVELQFLTEVTPATQARMKEISDEMQPLYEQLGGAFTSPMNLNYISKPKTIQ